MWGSMSRRTAWAEGSQGGGYIQEQWRFHKDWRVHGTATTCNSWTHQDLRRLCRGGLVCPSLKGKNRVSNAKELNRKIINGLVLIQETRIGWRGAGKLCSASSSLLLFWMLPHDVVKTSKIKLLAHWQHKKYVALSKSVFEWGSEQRCNINHETTIFCSGGQRWLHSSWSSLNNNAVISL